MPVSELLLLPHTHHDVGYTNSPRLLAEQHVEVVDHVLDLTERDESDDQDAFRWSFEVARPVREHLRRAGPDGLRRLSRLTRRGRIGVTGGLLNMTQLPGTREVETAYADLDLWREHGIDVRTQQHGDVNGLSWGTAAAMRRAGIGRLLMALNPDHGMPPLRQPSVFRWELPDPALPPLFVLLSTHYGIGEEWGIVDGRPERAIPRIEEFIDELDSREDWPFTAAVVHAGNDNRWPDSRFRAIVRAWNEAHPELPMRTATTDQAMDALEQQSSTLELPVLRGEWADWWAHGHGSTAREVSVYRRAREFAATSDHLRAVARLQLPAPGDAAPAPRTASVLGYRRGPHTIHSEPWREATRARVDELLQLFGEHTFGSWDSVSDPEGWNARSQWNAKASQAWQAWELARALHTESLFEAAAPWRSTATEATDAIPGTEDTGPALLELGSDLTVPSGDVLTVVNPSAQHRRELIRDDRGHLAMADVPPLAVRAVPVEPAPHRAAGTQIATDRYELEVDPARGGIISWRDRRTGRELLDPALPPLGAVVDERFPRGAAHPMMIHRKGFHPRTPGPRTTAEVLVGRSGSASVLTGKAVRSLQWETGDDVFGATVTATLADDLDALDLEVTLSTPERHEPESVHVSLPVAAASPRFLLESEGAVFEADAEQLPDTARSWYSVQHAVGVTGEDGGGMTVITADAPLVQLGRIRTTEWSRSLGAVTGLVSSWVMNNLYFTNFQAAQHGTVTFRYRLVPGRPDRRGVRVAGHHAAHPLVVRRIAEPPRDLTTPVALRRADGGEIGDDILLELRPVGGTASSVEAVLRSATTADVDVTVVLGTRSHAVTVPALGRASIVLDGEGHTDV